MSHINKMWDSTIKDLDINNGVMLWNDGDYDYRRVYLFEESVYKIVMSTRDPSLSIRKLGLKSEYDMLILCRQLSGVPSPIRYFERDGVEVLVMEHIPGTNMSLKHFGFFEYVVTLFKVLFLVGKLTTLGISQSDLRPENVIMGSDGKIYLTDFDQAEKCGLIKAFMRMFKVNPTRPLAGNNSIFNMAIKRIKDAIPENIKYRLRNRLRVLKTENSNKLPDIPAGKSEKLDNLYTAWKIAQHSDANAPERGLAYYSMVAEGYYFPGERPWMQRWNAIRSITEYKNKKILELGCNMGLLSAFLLKEGGIRQAIGVDHDESILKSARFIGNAFGVTPKLIKVDFNHDPDWECVLGQYNVDIVFSLNVLNWLKNRDRYLAFLGQYSELIYEGHDGYAIETNRLRKVGYVKFQAVYMSDRSRELIYCTK